jgi:G2/mitotic-specific cyclin 1/2
MHRQTANPRRATSRSRNDENALPIASNAGVMRSKTSMSHLGPAQRAAGIPAGAGVVGAKKGTTAAVKAGAKRTALGGVVGNRVKEEEVMDRKPCESARNLCHTDADKDGGRGRRAHQEW